MPKRKTEYCVHTGAPSWHQQRAGHISAAMTCYARKRDAEAYMRRMKKYHPYEPVFIRKERIR